MSTTYDKVLADLKKGSDTVEEAKGTFPPTLKLHSKGGTSKGAFVSGVLKSRKLVTINLKQQPVYSLILETTNAKILKKEDKKWVDSSAKPGELVSFFAPTRLDRILRDLGGDVKVVIHYDGMEPQKTPHGMKDTHMFTVHYGKSSVGGDSNVEQPDAAPAVEKPSSGGTPESDPFA